jgi:hypothetical protein
MTFTATDIMAWATMIGAIFAGLAGLITALRTGRIEHSVNSTATAQTALNTSLQVQNDMLKEALAEQVRTAAVLAAAASTKPHVEDPPR